MSHKISDYFYKKMIKGLSRVIESGKIPLPDTDEPIAADSGADLNFIAFGDPQISVLSPLRSARLYSALRDIKNASGSFDALILAGDITEYGARCEYKTAAKLINGVADRFANIIAVPGNHDIRLRNFRKQLKRFAAFVSEIKNGTFSDGESYFFSKTVNGYKFIMLGADKSAFEASYHSDFQLQRLEEEIKSADESKPVFVINHHPLKYTNGLPESWMGKGSRRGSVGAQSNRLKEIFERNGRIVYITGHLHYGISAFNFEDYGKYKCISLPTVGVLNHGKNDKLSQGYVFTVKGSRVTARGRCFCEGRYYTDSTENSTIDFDIEN